MEVIEDDPHSGLPQVSQTDANIKKFSEID